jgi:CubicO group peptidase (beta-lactamase class C family)
MLTPLLLLTVAQGVERVLPAHEEGELLRERVLLFDESIDPVNRLSGVLIVARGDELLLHTAFGMADREHGVPNALDTRFCVASITKIMTLVVTSRLARAGELTPADTLGKFLPDFPRGDEIKIEHLLNHRAGFPARVTGRDETWRPLSAAEVTQRAAEAELLFAPGSRSVYSSTNYTVLARVLELASGRTFRELLSEHVFEPAGMQDSLDPSGIELVARRARPYMPGRETLLNAPPQDMSFLAGAGSVVATAMDLWRFLRACKSELYFPGVWTTVGGPGGIHWTGASNGFHAFVEHDPSTEVTFIFAGNSYGRAAGELRSALPRLLAGEDVLAAPPPATIRLAPEFLARYAGCYETRPGSYAFVEELNGELMIHDTVALPVSETQFWYQPWNSLLTFERASAQEPWRIRPAGQAPWTRVGDVDSQR